MSEPAVREATDDDIRAIVEDYASGNLSPLNPFTSIQSLKQLTRKGLLVAEVDGRYAGFLYWFTADNPPLDSNVGRYACIAIVHVRKEFWRTKVGMKLLARSLKDMDAEPVKAIYFEAPNKTLEELFEKLGFTTYARTPQMRFLYPLERNRKERSRDEARELMVFMVEAREQCRAFMTAFSELIEMLATGPAPDDAEAQRVFSSRVWSRLQAALASCAVVSKILWTQKVPRSDSSDKVAIRRASTLRSILGLPNRSPFPLAVRNAFEHVDERLAEWLPEQKEDIPWGWSLSPFVGSEDPASSKAFRYFNMRTMELRVADAHCNLKEVMEQMRLIEDKMPEDAHVNFRSL